MPIFSVKKQHIIINPSTFKEMFILKKEFREIWDFNRDKTDQETFNHFMKFRKYKVNSIMTDGTSISI